ncbi:hypothetical protein SEPCBS57363_005101 [Sporothrix epigloea]|uniref:Uncharacterized protein n=1 Tax=Sporothrix epigloea TaxID=1892477 RepID=A0ABP0DXW3_9PEZI
MSESKEVPVFVNEEDFFKWWKTMKNVIRKHEMVAFLNPEDPRYAGWDVNRARLEVCQSPFLTHGRKTLGPRNAIHLHGVLVNPQSMKNHLGNIPAERE